jgi:hypothetical protein
MCSYEAINIENLKQVIQIAVSNLSYVSLWKISVLGYTYRSVNWTIL